MGTVLPGANTIGETVFPLQNYQENGASPRPLDSRGHHKQQLIISWN